MGGLRYCNCAGCKAELLGLSLKRWWESQSPTMKAKLGYPTHGKVGGRPYCRPCLMHITRESHMPLSIDYGEGLQVVPDEAEGVAQDP